jgi:hypothetical protein
MKSTLGVIAAVVMAAGSGVAAAQDEGYAPVGPEQAAATAPRDRDPAAGLPRDLVEAASAYEVFVDQAGAIDARFANGQAIAAAMTTAETYQPEQLSRGVIAYVAMVALQDPRFVAGVRRAAMASGPDAIAAALEADPGRVVALDGAQDEAVRVSGVLTAQADRLSDTGRRVKQSAYDIQHQAWSLKMVADGQERLARAKALSSAPYAPTDRDIARLYESAALEAQNASAGGTAAITPSPEVQRGLALAALAVLGEADGREVEQAGLTRVPDGQSCTHMAKLNLYQCLAVAGPHYEHMFCLGEHALKETGECLSQAAAMRATSVAAAPVDGYARRYAAPMSYASRDAYDDGR